MAQLKTQPHARQGRHHFVIAARSLTSMKKLRSFFKKYYNYFPADLWAYILMILIMIFGLIFIL